MSLLFRPAPIASGNFSFPAFIRCQTHLLHHNSGHLLVRFLCSLHPTLRNTSTSFSTRAACMNKDTLDNTQSSGHTVSLPTLEEPNGMFMLTLGRPVKMRLTISTSSGDVHRQASTTTQTHHSVESCSSPRETVGPFNRL